MKYMGEDGRVGAGMRTDLRYSRTYGRRSASGGFAGARSQAGMLSIHVESGREFEKWSKKLRLLRAKIEHPENVPVILDFR
jgi:hypothetical protein